MTMLTDGLKSKSLEDKVKQLDVAELLDQACASPKIEIAQPPLDPVVIPPPDAAPTALAATDPAPVVE